MSILASLDLLRLNGVPPLLPLSLPPRFLPLIEVSVFTIASVTTIISTAVESSLFIFTLGPLLPLPLRPSILTPSLFAFPVGVIFSAKS